MTSIQSLPPLPSSLKPVSPYVQRASELKAQDPVMAYWCMTIRPVVSILFITKYVFSLQVLIMLLRSALMLNLKSLVLANTYSPLLRFSKPCVTMSVKVAAADLS